MLKLIKGAEIYSPQPLGVHDVLLEKDKIVRIDKEIELPLDLLDIQVIDGGGQYLVPGFIDSHEHIIGGGGEGGFATRTPPIKLSQLIESGITTVFGCLGTDSTTRNLKDLLAQARALDEEGLTTYIYTGSYSFPVATITGSIQEDMILIDKVIGTGELALADHRSSQPTYPEFSRAVSQSRLGGMLSHKSGIVNIHIGDGKEPLAYLKKLGTNSEIPLSQMLPTHINRNRKLIDKGIEYACQGGLVDLTTSISINLDGSDITKCSNTLSLMLTKGVDIENITFSSDAQGSLPIFDKDGNFQKLGLGRARSLYREVREAVLEKDLPLETALKVITANPARIFGLENKGIIEEGKDADLVLLNGKNLQIESVLAAGELMMYKGNLQKKGQFE